MAAFEGVWNVIDATLPDRTFGYTGMVTIAQRNGVYTMDSDITAGRYVGIGLKVDDHLLVSCGEQFAGLGLAREAAMATLAYGKQMYELKKILAIVSPSNARSIRLLERLDFVYDIR